MGIAWPAALLGLIALALPLLIHLLARGEFQRVAVATTQFVRERPRLRWRRMQISHPLLLALRLALVALCVLLIGEPFRHLSAGSDGGTPWTLVSAQVEAAQARVLTSDGNAAARWLAPGFPSLDEPRPQWQAGQLWSLIDAADRQAPGGAAFDIIVPTNWVAARLIDRGWVEPIPLEIVPNHANIDPSFLTPSWDRGARFHMPWQVGITGIAYNQELTGGEIRSLAQIFDGSADFAIGFIPEMREALGLAMLLDGADPSRPTEATANAAMEHLEAAFRREQVRFTYDFRDGLQDGSLAAAMSWSGDVVQMQRDFSNIEFVIPDEGAVQWFDTMVIPQSSQAVGAAGKFMNYVYDPVNAARITNWVQYISPVVGVQDALVDLGADAAQLAENEILFPAIETRRRLFSWGSLDTAVEEQLEARFDLLIA